MGIEHFDFDPNIWGLPGSGRWERVKRNMGEMPRLTTPESWEPEENFESWARRQIDKLAAGLRAVQSEERRIYARNMTPLPRTAQDAEREIELRVQLGILTYRLEQAEALLAEQPAPAPTDVPNEFAGAVHEFQEHNAYGNDCHYPGCQLSRELHLFRNPGHEA
jgi:hypothetical protein